MNTRGVKTIIIILLCAANLFFMYNTLLLNRRIRYIPADMIESAAKILTAEHNIEISPQYILARRPVHSIHEFIYSDANYHNIVRSFSGATDEEISNGRHTTHDDGIAFNVGEYRFRFDDFMLLEIIKSDYWEGDTAANIETMEMIAAYYTEISASDLEAARNIIHDFLSQYPEQSPLTDFNIIGLRRENGRDKVLINQTMDGLLISSHTALVVISDSPNGSRDVKYFFGRWYFGDFIDYHETPLLDAVNILFRSLEQDSRLFEEGTARLVGMEKQFHIIPHQIERFYLALSWILSFDDGESVRTFSYDMITGRRNN